MKIVIIHGQSHKQVTYHVGRQLVETLTTKENITEFLLPKDMPHFCLGCYTCMLQGEEFCPHYVSLAPITKAIKEADVLVFTTPVYCFRTTGSMKAFLDHYFTWWTSHRPKQEMYTKKAVIISAGAGAGMKKAISDIAISLRYWGISTIYKHPFRSQVMLWQDMTEKRKQKIDKNILKLANKIKTKHSKVSIRNKILFLIMRKMHGSGSGVQQDAEYWREQGWLDTKRPWQK